MAFVVHSSHLVHPLLPYLVRVRRVLWRNQDETLGRLLGTCFVYGAALVGVRIIYIRVVVYLQVFLKRDFARVDAGDWAQGPLGFLLD